MYTGTDCDMLCIQAGATGKLLWAGVSSAGSGGGKAAARGRKNKIWTVTFTPLSFHAVQRHAQW